MMSFSLSPGRSYLLRTVTQRLVGPPAAIFACYKLATVYRFDQWIPRLLRSASGLCIATIGIISLYITVSSIWSSVQTRRACRRLGAVPLPQMKGKWLGNLDIIFRSAKFAAEEYLGEGFELLCCENSDLFLFRIPWNESVCLLIQNELHQSTYYSSSCQVLTYNPHYIKEILVTQFPNFIKGKDSFEA